MKHIVIVGIAQGLDKVLDPTNHTLTLLSQTDYYRYHPAALRALVTAEGSLEKDMCLPYDKIFGKGMAAGKGRVGTVRFGTVESVEEHKGGDGGYVNLKEGDTLPWDVLVVTTGSIWNGPLRWPEKRADAMGFLQNWRAKFASAKSIALVGGGSVGTELAGEILDFYPSTIVNLVHRDSLVLSGAYPDVFRRKIANGLLERGATLVLGDSVTLTKEVMDGTNSINSGGTISTGDGVRLPAELVRCPYVFPLLLLVTACPYINQALHTDGHLLVTPTFQLMTNRNVFAVGDVVAIPEQHSLVKIHVHEPIVVANILALLHAQEQNDSTQSNAVMKEYGGATESLVITNGRFRRTLYMDYFTYFGYPIMLGNWISSMLKSRGLLVGKAKAMVNQ